MAEQSWIYMYTLEWNMIGNPFLNTNNMRWQKKKVVIYKLLLPITDDWYAIPIFRTRQCVLWYFAKFMFFYCRFVCIQYSNSCDSCSDLFEYFNESITIAMKYCWYRFLDMVMSMSTNSSVHWEISAWIRISMLRSDSIRVSIIIINATSIGYLIFAEIEEFS